MPLILNDEDWNNVEELPGDIFDQLISSSLGCDFDLEDSAISSEPCTSPDIDDETKEALGNLLSDTDGVYSSNLPLNAGKKKHFIKLLQPHRELPSKDQGKRFMAGSLYGDQGIPAEHNVQLFQFWAINLTKLILQKAHTFLIGQIIFMVHSGKTCISHQSTNTNLEVIFEIYKYDPDKMLYAKDGRSGLLKANKYLLFDITNNVVYQEDESKISFDHAKLPGLNSYVPYHDDVDLETRLLANGSSPKCKDQDEEYVDDSDPYIVDKVIKKRFLKRISMSFLSHG